MQKKTTHLPFRNEKFRDWGPLPRFGRPDLNPGSTGEQPQILRAPSNGGGRTWTLSVNYSCGAVCPSFSSRSELSKINASSSKRMTASPIPLPATTRREPIQHPHRARDPGVGCGRVCPTHNLFRRGICGTRPSGCPSLLPALYRPDVPRPLKPTRGTQTEVTDSKLPFPVPQSGSCGHVEDAVSAAISGLFQLVHVTW